MLNLPLLETELETVTNPLLDENGQFVKPDEAVRNFATLWKEWDLWNGFLSALPKIILAVLIIVAGFILASLVSKIMCKAMKRQKVDFAVYNFIAKIVRFIIRLTFVLCALSMFIKLNSLIAALSACSVKPVKEQLTSSVFSKFVSRTFVSVTSRMLYVIKTLYQSGSCRLNDVFSKITDRSERVATFLAVLELTRNGRIILSDDNSEISFNRSYSGDDTADSQFDTPAKEGGE